MIYYVKGYRITTVDPRDESFAVYETRNAALRARARYKIETGDWAWNYPKAICKHIAHFAEEAFDKIYSEAPKLEEIDWNCGAKTIKVARIECEGLADYTRVTKPNEHIKNFDGVELKWEIFDWDCKGEENGNK